MLFRSFLTCRLPLVAPRAGAWIETMRIFSHVPMGRSRPVRARGLKLDIREGDKPAVAVAPRAGAWIETNACLNARDDFGRAPCGRVD